MFLAAVTFGQQVLLLCLVADSTPGEGWRDSKDSHGMCYAKIQFHEYICKGFGALLLFFFNILLPNMLKWMFFTTAFMSLATQFCRKFNSYRARNLLIHNARPKSEFRFCFFFFFWGGGGALHENWRLYLFKVLISLIAIPNGGHVSKKINSRMEEREKIKWCWDRSRNNVKEIHERL